MSEQLIYLVEAYSYAGMDFATTVLRMALGLITPKNMAYDFDADGQLTVKDALSTMYYGKPYYFATAGYVDPLSGRYYEPRVFHPGVYRQDMFSRGTTGGASTGGYGEIVLLNSEGALDVMIDEGFDGRICIIKHGYASRPLAEFQSIFYGTIEQCSVSWGTVTLHVKDRSVELRKSIGTSKYAGNNALPYGIEGGPELFGKPKPLLYGDCKNITPVLVNSAKLVYQVNAGPVAAITTVHDGGNIGQITLGTDYATSALLLAPRSTDYAAITFIGGVGSGFTDLMVNALVGQRVWVGGQSIGTITANTATTVTIDYLTYNRASGTITIQTGLPDPAVSTYDTCLAEGLFRLNGPPFKLVTCDVLQGATVSDRTVGQIVKQIATRIMAGKGYVITQSIIDLDTAAPYVIGYYTGTAEIEFGTALDTICRSVGAWYGFDNFGDFWCKQLAIPTPDQSVMTLTTAEIVSVERLSTADSDKGIPIWKVSVDYNKNWTVQTSDLAGTLTAEQRNVLSQEYFRVSAEDSTVKDVHLLAPENSVQTLLTSAADASAEAARLLSLYSVRRDRLKATVKVEALRYPEGGVWKSSSVAQLPGLQYLQGGVIDKTFLYITGGFDGVTESAQVLRFNFGAHYDNIDDTGISDLPTTRYGHSAAFYGTYLYVIGGYINGVATSSVIRLNLATPTGAWDDVGVSDLPAARTGTRMAIVHNNYLYVVGGYVNNVRSASVIRLNLTAPTGAWDDVGVSDLPIGRTDVVPVLYNNFIYVTGGLLDSGITASVIRLDLNNPSGAWDEAGVSDLPVGQSAHTAVVIGNYLYVLGGTVMGGTPAACRRLDLNNPTGTWDDHGIVDLPDHRTYPLAFYSNQKLCLFGGTLTVGQATSLAWLNNTNPYDIPMLREIGRALTIKLPRYGYDAGRTMTIIGIEADFSKDQITLELWG